MVIDGVGRDIPQQQQRAPRCLDETPIVAQALAVPPVVAAGEPPARVCFAPLSQLGAGVLATAWAIARCTWPTAHTQKTPKSLANYLEHVHASASLELQVSHKQFVLQ